MVSSFSFIYKKYKVLLNKKKKITILKFIPYDFILEESFWGLFLMYIYVLINILKV